MAMDSGWRYGECSNSKKYPLCNHELHFAFYNAVEHSEAAGTVPKDSKKGVKELYLMEEALPLLSKAWLLFKTRFKFPQIL